MLEVIVFALVLVVAQFIAGIGVITIITSNWYLNKIMKKSMEMTKEMVKVMEEESWL